MNNFIFLHYEVDHPYVQLMKVYDMLLFCLIWFLSTGIDMLFMKSVIHSIFVKAKILTELIIVISS